MSDHDTSTAAAAAIAAFGLVWSIIALGFLAITLIVNWRIAVKAGYSGVLSLVMLVPLVNFIFLLIFAFAKWPIEQQLEQTRYTPPPGTAIVP